MKFLKQVAVACLGVVMPASGAHAAPFTAGSHYEENHTANCATYYCRAIFSPVPAGEPLLVTGVACRIEVNNGSLYFVELSLGLGNERREILQSGPATPLGTHNIYSVHDEARFYYAPGQRPSIYVQSNNGTNVNVYCRIVGTRPAPV